MKSIKPTCHIVVYKDAFCSGRGADRATATFVREMVARGMRVTVVTAQSPKTPYSVTFPKEVATHTIYDRNFKRSWLEKLLLRSVFGERILKRFLKHLDTQAKRSCALLHTIQALQPDVVISAGSNETIDLFYCDGLRTSVIQMIHVYPPEHFKKNKYRQAARFRDALQKVTACQVLMSSYEALVNPLVKSNVCTIGNAVTFPLDAPIPSMQERQKQIVYIAYFSKDKNHLQLLDAFAQLQNAEAWTLELYGSGTAKWEQRLRQRVEQLGITNRVHFNGITHDPMAVYTTASICAYPSLTEGLPLALVEAQWMGLPAVGLSTTPAVNELIKDGETGVLAQPNVTSFATALQTLVDHSALREQMGQRAAQSARRDYAPEHIWQTWEQLILHCCPVNFLE